MAPKVAVASKKLPAQAMPIAMATPQSPLQERAADEDSMAKAMKRAAIRNLDADRGNTRMVAGLQSTPIPCHILPGYLFGYPLAPYMDYSSKNYFTGFGCSGLSTFGAGGQRIFYPGTWVAV
jgi:hypothetical protein